MKIRLEGIVGKKFGYEHELDVRSPNEAIRALCQLIPGFRTYMSAAHERGIFFQLFTPKDAVGYDELAFGASEMTLVPVITGSNWFSDFFGGSFGKILLGIALVAFAFTGFGLMTVGSAIAPAIASLGFGLIFTGIAGLFAPGVPEQTHKTEGKPADEAITNAATGTAGDGTPVPVVYGQTLVTNIPVIASYIKDGIFEDEPEAFWMGLISEGEIKGFPDSAEENLFYNGLNGKAAGVDEVAFTDGSQTTRQFSFMKSAGFHMSVGSNFPVAGGTYYERVTDTSVEPNVVEIRSFNNPDAEKVRIRVLVPPFYQNKVFQNKDGSKQNYRDYVDDGNDNGGGADNPLRYKVEVFNANGDVINGSNADERIFPRLKKDKDDPDKTILSERNMRNVVEVIEVDVDGEPMPISVRIERVDRYGPKDTYIRTGKTSSTNFSWVKGDITWLSMEVLWAEKLVYPFSSLLACRFKAGAVTRLPAITALVKGRKIPVLNRNLSISYRYSRNPANVVLDLLLNPRYGAGHRTYTTFGNTVVQPGIRESDIDKASFYKAQKYCDDHDITFDATIAGDADTIELLRSITSTFQGQLIYAGGYVTVVIDEAAESSADRDDYRLFTEANVLQSRDGDKVAEPCFVYEGTGKRARTTAVQVSYIDKQNFYKEAKVLVEDRDAMQKYGYNLQKIRALGCTDPEQAQRMGRYTLATNLRSTETVSFKVGPEGGLLLPGDVCLIGDPLKTRIQAGGRIVSATATKIVLDRDLTTGVDYTSDRWDLYIYTASGTAERSQVVAVSGNTVDVSGFNSVPSSNMLWVLVHSASNNNNDHRFNRYRIQKVSEQERGTYQVIAIKYDEAKYDYVNTASASYGSSKSLSKGKNKVLDISKISFKIRNP